MKTKQKFSVVCHNVHVHTLQFDVASRKILFTTASLDWAIPFYEPTPPIEEETRPTGRNYPLHPPWEQIKNTIIHPYR